MSGRRTAAALAMLAVTAAAAVYGLTLWSSGEPARTPAERCTASLGEASTSLSAEQADHAALIAAGSVRLGLPARAATIGIATALQESSLYNLDHGDRDSLGLFQQRPSQGWGTPAQVMDPYHATDRFYRALTRVDGWRDMEVTVAAQTVQRSAFPDAYATREAAARLWASALRGHSGAIAVDCDVSPGPGTTPQEFVARVTADLGDGHHVRVLRAGPEEIWLDVVTDDATGADAFASWAVAVAASASVEEVVNGDARWARDRSPATADAAPGAEGVAIRLAPVAAEGG